MANTCTGCFMFFGKREAVLQALQTNFPPKHYYDLAANASRIAHMTGDMKAPDQQFLQQLKGWMLTSSKDPEALKSGDDALTWTTYNGDVSKRCIFNKQALTEADVAFFDDWVDEQAKARRNLLRQQDLADAFKTSSTSHADSSKPSTQDVFENMEKIIVQLQVMMDTPRLSLVNDWDLRCAINREVLGNRSDLFQSENVWTEYEDDYVLFSVSGDFKWWCAVDGTRPVSVMHPDLYVGVAYLEEQGIFGQRLYHNGNEVLKTVGPAGTLPGQFTEVVTEYGENYRRIKWGKTMEWQIGLVKQAMFNSVGISSEPMNNSEDNNV